MLDSCLTYKPLSNYLTDLETEEIYSLVAKYPACRTLFITIRDPKQATWAKLGKCNDWIRRYSKNYWIVRGTKGGSHFHILAFIDEGKTPKPQKSIHFDIKMVGINTKQFSVPTREEYVEKKQTEEKIIYFKYQKFEELTSELTVKQQNILLQIILSVKKYFKQKLNRKHRVKKLKGKKGEAARILNYMENNLHEEREDGDDPEMYIDFLCKLSKS